MPGIPYMLEYIRNILSTRYARNTFSIIVCTQNIKHNNIPRNLELCFVCFMLNDASTLVGQLLTDGIKLNMIWMEKVKICNK